MFRLIVYQALLISTSLSKFSKVVNWFEILIWYCSLTFFSLSSLRRMLEVRNVWCKSKTPLFFRGRLASHYLPIIFVIFLHKKNWRHFLQFQIISRYIHLYYVLEMFRAVREMSEKNFRRHYEPVEAMSCVHQAVPVATSMYGDSFPHKHVSTHACRRFDGLHRMWSPRAA
jgi:hypothetical protein